MTKREIIPIANASNSSIKIAGCVSYTVRALNIAAMVQGSVTIKDPLKSDDTYAMYNILRDLGINVEEQDDAFIVHGHINDVVPGDYTLNVNISGRTARTSLSLLCLVPGTKTVICEEGFKKRPVDELVDGLRQMGAQIEYLDEEGYLPVKITSSTLNPGKVSMKGEVSSQYFSSIMMVAPIVGEVEIEVVGEQSSKPFIDITTDIMRTFGVKVINDNYRKYTVEAGQSYSCNQYTVESDAIAASYFWAIAALHGCSVKVLDLSPNSAQGDIAFADILGRMGCIVTKNEGENWIEVTGTGSLKAIEVDMNDTPDSVQTLAVIAAFATGTTKITGIAHLKYKESNRIEAPVAELKKLGIAANCDDDSMTIVGGQMQPGEVMTYGDHRMAMAFAAAGSVVPGVIIQNPNVVSKSYPHFWSDYAKLGVQSNEYTV